MNRLILLGIVCTLSMVAVEATVKYCVDAEQDFVERDNVTLDISDGFFYGVASVLDAETTRSNNLDADFCSLATFSHECGSVLFSKNGNKRQVLAWDLKTTTFTHFNLEVEQIGQEETNGYFFQNKIIGNVQQMKLGESEFRDIDVASLQGKRKAAYEHFIQEIQEPFGLVNSYSRGKLLHYQTCQNNDDRDSFFITNIKNVEIDDLTKFENTKKYTLFDHVDEGGIDDFLKAIKYMITISPGMPDYIEEKVGGTLAERIKKPETRA